MLLKQGITNSEINQLRFEAQNVELLDSHKIASRELRETLARLGARIHLLDDTEVNSTLGPFLSSGPDLSQKIKNLNTKLQYNQMTRPEYALYLYRFGIGVIVLRQLLELGANTETLDTVQNSFLVNLDQFASVASASSPANTYLVSTFLKETLREAGGSGDPDLTSTLATKWRENHPRRLDLSLSIFGKSVVEVLSILKREPVFILIGAWVGMGTKTAFTLAAHSAGHDTLVAPIMMLDTLIAGFLGYASWFRYQINVKRVEKGKPILIRNSGLKILSNCRQLLNLSRPAPRLLENPAASTETTN